MKRDIAQTLVTVCLASFCLASTSLAGTYWVSPDGKAQWQQAESATPLSAEEACSLAVASANADAGDSVYLRGGTYSGQEIRPGNSGTSDDQRIIFSNYDGEEVLIEESDGIHIEEKSYITITGLQFRDMKLFFRIHGGHYNTINDCLFDGRSKDSVAWAGAAIVPDRRRRPSTHNWVHHCRFYRFAYQDRRPNAGALLDIGYLNNGTGENGSTHNRIENNVFAYGGHHTLGVYSKYNVIRFNYIHNETNPDLWDCPGYRGAVTQGTSGGSCLYEGNRFGHCGQAGIGLRSPNNILRGNLFYQNAQGGIQVVTNAIGQDRADENYIYHNTFFHNGHKEKYPGFQGGMYFASWKGISPKGNVVHNNLFFDNKNGSITYDRPADPQSIENNWNNSDDPGFVDPSGTDPSVADLPDLRLSPNSSARDRGQWLSSVTSDTNTGSSFRVADSRYFIDGWGIVEGDQIQIEGQAESAKITSVDYETHTITVDRDLNVVKGQGVSLAYSGLAPDPGAFEIRDESRL